MHVAIVTERPGGGMIGGNHDPSDQYYRKYWVFFLIQVLISLASNLILVLVMHFAIPVPLHTELGLFNL